MNFNLFYILTIHIYRLNYLDKQLAAVPPIQRNSDEWQALFTYRNSLVQGEHEIHPITLKQAAQKRYGKRKNITNIDGKFGCHVASE